MSCQKKSILSAYLDGELTQKETNLFQEHLERCPVCSQAYQEFQRLASLLRERPQEDLPLGFFNRLEARIEREKEANAVWQRLELTAKKLVPVFVFLLLITGLISFFPGFSTGIGPEALTDAFADTGESELLFTNFSGGSD